MQCKDIEIEVCKDNPFRNDKLNRAHFANMLTSVIDIYSDKGCVLSLNGEWGSGKTTFVRMWKQQLEDKGYTTLYFNTWENDYNEDPFVVILGELKKKFDSNGTMREIITKGCNILLKISDVISQKYIGVDSGILSSDISDLYSKKINEYYDYKEMIESFKDSLGEFVADRANGKPIVFFVDELDRCNPHYAVKVLERIKHIFDIPTIAFIVAVNEDQLQYAIQGFYGSDRINGKEYLRRFFDINFTLPKPSIEDYITFLYHKHNYDTVFPTKQFHRDMGNVFLNFAKILFSGADINLRLVNKIFIYIRLSICGYNPGEHIPSDTFLLLYFFKVCYPVVYDNIKHNEYSIQELIDAIELNLPIGVFYDKTDPYVSSSSSMAIARLLLYYRYAQKDGKDQFPNFEVRNIDGQDYKHYDIITNKINKYLLDKALTMLENELDFKNGIYPIISKIELSRGLNIY